MIQQLVRYVQAGYRFYHVGCVGRKDASVVDERPIEKFGIAKSPQQRARAKKRGEANLQYIRIGDFSINPSTEGRHRFFDAHFGKDG